MDDHLAVFESWLLVDPALRAQAERLYPDEVLEFRYTANDKRSIKAVFTYEQVRFVLAKLVLKGFKWTAKHAARGA